MIRGPPDSAPDYANKRPIEDLTLRLARIFETHIFGRLFRDMPSNKVISVSSRSARRGILWPTVVGTVVLIFFLAILSEQQYPKYANNGSGIRISSVAYPNVFYPLAWSHLCLAAISLAKAEGQFLKRFSLAIGTIWIWSSIIDRYDGDAFDRTPAHFMITGSAIYLGLSVGRLDDEANSQMWAAIRSCRQISVRHLFIAIAWMSLWIILEHEHARRVGFVGMAMSYVSYSLPFAVLSLALVRAVNLERSNATSDLASAKLIGRVLLAVGVGVGTVAMATTLASLRTYLWVLLSNLPAVPTRHLSHTMELFLVRSTRITICGFMIVPWLVALHLASPEAPKRQDLRCPISRT